MTSLRKEFPAMGLAVAGKASIIIGGQFGSEGKGLAASYAAASEDFTIAVSIAAPNAGHTFHDAHGRRHVASHLPACGVLRPRTIIHLAAGSVIDPDRFLAEIARLEVDPARVSIDPRAAVIRPQDVAFEDDPASMATAIASTQKGVGRAVACKAMRETPLAKDCPSLQGFVRDIEIGRHLARGASALIEVPQGVGLGLNAGLAYPYVTSREISVSAALAECGLHPKDLGRTLMVVRLHPIRVGDITDEDGLAIGHSGPFYPDSRELGWEELGQAPERTTVTGRIRRVATFSWTQYRHAVRLCWPDFVLLNFANYARDAAELVDTLRTAEAIAPMTHLGFGPAPHQVIGAPDWLADLGRAA